MPMTNEYVEIRMKDFDYPLAPMDPATLQKLLKDHPQLRIFKATKNIELKFPMIFLDPVRCSSCESSSEEPFNNYPKCGNGKRGLCKLVFDRILSFFTDPLLADFLF